MIGENKLVEHAQHVNHYYGISKEHVDEKISEGRDMILEIEIQSTLKVKKRFPDAPLLFVTPPSTGGLRHRLVRRGTKTVEVIDVRLRHVAEEVMGAGVYDYLLINDKIQPYAEQMYQLIQLQYSKTSCHLDFLGRV